MTGDYNITAIHVEAALQQCVTFVSLNTTLQNANPVVTTSIQSLCPSNCSGHGVCNKGMSKNLLRCEIVLQINTCIYFFGKSDLVYLNCTTINLQGCNKRKSENFCLHRILMIIRGKWYIND